MLNREHSLHCLFFRLAANEIPGGLRVVGDNSDVDKFLTIQVKESHKEEWEKVVNPKIEDDGNGSFFFNFMSPQDKVLDFRILITRKSQGQQETYLFFEIGNKLVYSKYKRKNFLWFASQVLTISC